MTTMLRYVIPTLTASSALILFVSTTPAFGFSSTTPMRLHTAALAQGDSHPQCGQRRQADKNAAAYAHAQQTYIQEREPPPQEQYASPEYAPAPQEDLIAQLDLLGALKTQGLLTEEEFAAARAKLLTG